MSATNDNSKGDRHETFIFCEDAITQEISNEWPESFTTDVYHNIFQVTKEGETIVNAAPEKTIDSIIFLDEQERGQLVLVDHETGALKLTFKRLIRHQDTLKAQVGRSNAPGASP